MDVWQTRRSEERQQEALDAGADYVGAQDMVDRITKENFFDYDVVVATPDMMGIVVEEA